MDNFSLQITASSSMPGISIAAVERSARLLRRMPANPLSVPCGSAFLTPHMDFAVGNLKLHFVIDNKAPICYSAVLNPS